MGLNRVRNAVKEHVVGEYVDVTEESSSPKFKLVAGLLGVVLVIGVLTSFGDSESSAVPVAISPVTTTVPPSGSSFVPEIPVATTAPPVTTPPVTTVAPPVTTVVPPVTTPSVTTPPVTTVAPPVTTPPVTTVAPPATTVAPHVDPTGAAEAYYAANGSFTGLTNGVPNSSCDTEVCMVGLGRQAIVQSPVAGGCTAFELTDGVISAVRTVEDPCGAGVLAEIATSLEATVLTTTYTWGQSFAAKTLQAVLGLPADGYYGPTTRSAHLAENAARGLTTAGLANPPVPTTTAPPATTTTAPPPTTTTAPPPTTTTAPPPTTTTEPPCPTYATAASWTDAAQRGVTNTCYVPSTIRMVAIADTANNVNVTVVGWANNTPAGTTATLHLMTPAGAKHTYVYTGSAAISPVPAHGTAPQTADYYFAGSYVEFTYQNISARTAPLKGATS